MKSRKKKAAIKREVSGSEPYTFGQLLANLQGGNSILAGKVDVFDEGRLQGECARHFATGIVYESVVGLRDKVCRERELPPDIINGLDAQAVVHMICDIQRVSLGEFMTVAQDAVANNQYPIDKIHIGAGYWPTISRADCLIVPGNEPTLCPNADPVMPVALLPSVEQAFRRLGLIDAGNSIHWVGVRSFVRNKCRCFIEPATPTRIVVRGSAVFVDGHEVPLDFTKEKLVDALCFIRHVVAMKGIWISGPEIADAEKKENKRDLENVRWDRVFNALPEQIKVHIESNRRKGYRLTVT